MCCFKYTNVDYTASGVTVFKYPWWRRLNFRLSVANIRPLLLAPCGRTFTMPYFSTGMLQIAPLSFGKQHYGMMVTFSNNSLLEINTRLRYWDFLIYKELMEYWIHCILPEEVCSFSLNSDHKFYKYAVVVLNYK